MKKRQFGILILVSFICIALMAPAPALADEPPAPVKAVGKFFKQVAWRTGAIALNVALLPRTIVVAAQQGFKNPKAYLMQQHLPEGFPTVFRGVNAPVDEVMGTGPKALALAFAPPKKVKAIMKNVGQPNVIAKKGMKLPPVVNMSKTLLYAASVAAPATGAVPAAWAPVSHGGQVAIGAASGAAVGAYGPAVANEMLRLES